MCADFLPPPPAFLTFYRNRLTRCQSLVVLRKDDCQLKPPLAFFSKHHQLSVVNRPEFFSLVFWGLKFVI